MTHRGKFATQRPSIEVIGGPVGMPALTTMPARSSSIDDMASGWEAGGMANTAALQQAIEWVRGDLGDRHHTSFTKSRVRLRTGGVHTFNAVGADGSVVATVTNHSGATSGGKKPVGKIKSAIAELYWLSLVDAPLRLLVMTNRDFPAILESELDGALVERLSLVHVALPVDLANAVAGVSKAASDEMR
jgi:hypothetical protein